MDLTSHDAFPGRVRLSPGLPEVSRLGLATRGDGRLDAADVRRAIDAGIGYLNWCGRPDGLSRAVSDLSPAERERVVVAFQLEARRGTGAGRELEAALTACGTGWIDVVTFYYVEHEHEWQEIIGSAGALEAMLRAREEGQVRLIGMTTHQRRLGARAAATGLLDLLMIRYNAAHRGAATEVFPVTRARGLPVVAFTAQRWSALTRSTPADPPGYVPPSAEAWYRFVLAQPDISIALMAPHDGRELDENLRLLQAARPPDEAELAALREHGDRVRAWAGRFP